MRQSDETEAIHFELVMAEIEMRRACMGNMAEAIIDVESILEWRRINTKSSLDDELVCFY
jgi:hypothetical protein